MKASDKLKQMKKDIENGLENNPDLDFILKDIPELIERRTRLGKGVDKSGGLVKLKPLSEKYIEQRKKTNLSELTTAKRSNLTRTGEMLSSIFGSRDGTIFTFFFAGSRSDGYNNSEIAVFARKNGRPFFDLSTSERNGLSRKISKVIKESIKKVFDK